MNKKFLIGLFVISLIVFAGGCGGGSHSVNESTDVNSALNGAWSSSTNGTATITITNEDSDDLDSFIEAFGEIPSELLEQYEEAKKNETVEPLKVSVTSAMAFFEDCNILNDKGTAKFTAIVILSDDFRWRYFINQYGFGRKN